MHFAKTHWRFGVCFFSYLLFIVGFWPTGFLPEARAFAHTDALELGLLFVLFVFFVIYPAHMLSGHVGEISRVLYWIVLVLLILGHIPLALLSALESEAGFYIMCMRLAGVIAFAMIFSACSGSGGISFRFPTAIACAVLITLGTWSSVSGLVMVTQAERLTDGGPYRISLYRQGRLKDPNWWKLRASGFWATYGNAGELPYFHFHATMRSSNGGPAYFWSKRYMRFDPMTR